MTRSSRTKGPVDQAERAIVLQVLRDDHPERWTRVELEEEIEDRTAQVIADTLARLEAEGVVILDGEHVRGVGVRAANGLSRAGVDLMPRETPHIPADLNVLGASAPTRDVHAALGGSYAGASEGECPTSRSTWVAAARGPIGQRPHLTR